MGSKVLMGPTFDSKLTLLGHVAREMVGLRACLVGSEALFKTSATNNLIEMDHK